MDEAVYRERIRQAEQVACPFAKAILSACAACTQATRVQVAERELVVCETPACHRRCDMLHDLLRHNFGFAIGQLRDEAPIPHAQEMRIQCGGLRALSQVLRDQAEVADVDDLLRGLLQRWPDPMEIPYAEVVHAARLLYKGRRG
ncbi:MAG: hypothetical protein OHK0054_05320 [Sideroxydans sp.]